MISRKTINVYIFTIYIINIKDQIINFLSL